MGRGKPPEPRGPVEIEYMARQFEGLAINIAAGDFEGDIDLGDACMLIAKAIRWTIDPSPSADRDMDELVDGLNSYLAIAELDGDTVRGLLGFGDPDD